MNETLLDKVSAENVDMLIGALSEILSEMCSIEENQENRHRDDTYCTCLSLNSIALASLRRHAREKTAIDM
jgi:hypothetical protein